MEHGRRTIIAEFQNTVTTLSSRNIKAHRLDDAQLETEGVCGQTTARLKLAHDHQEREIAKLHEQIELAEAGKGWVLQALNSYEQGFRLGLKSAIEFDLLASEVAPMKPQTISAMSSANRMNARPATTHRRSSASRPSPSPSISRFSSGRRPAISLPPGFSDSRRISRQLSRLAAPGSSTWLNAWSWQHPSHGGSVPADL